MKDQIAKRIFELTAQSKAIESELSELKELLKPFGTQTYGNYEVQVSDCYRETFSVKTAKESLPETIWNKISKFVKGTSYQSVRVILRKEEAA